MNAAAKLFTKKLTTGSLTFTEDDGWKSISVYNSKNATANGTILGTGVLGSTASDAIDVEPGVAATTINRNSSFASVVITCPSGAVLSIMASTN